MLSNTHRRVLKRFFVDGLIPAVMKKSGLVGVALGQIMKAGTINAAKKVGSEMKKPVAYI